MKNLNKKTALAFALGAVVTSGVGITAVSFASDANQNINSEDTQCRCPVINMERGDHKMRNGEQEQRTVGKITSINGSIITIESIKMEKPELEQIDENIEENSIEKPEITFETTTYTVDISNAKITKIEFDSESKKPTESELLASDIVVGNYIAVKGETQENNIVAEEVKIEQERPELPEFDGEEGERPERNGMRGFGRRGFEKMKKPSDSTETKLETQEN